MRWVVTNPSSFPPHPFFPHIPIWIVHSSHRLINSLIRWLIRPVHLWWFIWFFPQITHHNLHSIPYTHKVKSTEELHVKCIPAAATPWQWWLWETGSRYEKTSMGHLQNQHGLKNHPRTCNLNFAHDYLYDLGGVVLCPIEISGFFFYLILWIWPWKKLLITYQSFSREKIIIIAFYTKQEQ